MILLAADVSALIDLFKQCGEMLAGVGFVCAGLAVIKKIITNHEKMKEAIITYIVRYIECKYSNKYLKQQKFCG